MARIILIITAEAVVDNLHEEDARGDDNEANQDAEGHEEDGAEVNLPLSHPDGVVS